MLLLTLLLLGVTVYGKPTPPTAAAPGCEVHNGNSVACLAENSLPTKCMSITLKKNQCARGICNKRKKADFCVSLTCGLLKKGKKCKKQKGCTWATSVNLCLADQYAPCVDLKKKTCKKMAKCWVQGGQCVDALKKSRSVSAWTYQQIEDSLMDKASQLSGVPISQFTPFSDLWDTPLDFIDMMAWDMAMFADGKFGTDFFGDCAKWDAFVWSVRVFDMALMVADELGVSYSG